MAILSKGNTFATGDQVTALKLNNLVDSSTFASGAVDDSTTQLNGSGQIIVKDSGITSAKLNLSATGQSQNIATFTAVQDSGNRAFNIRTPASTSDLDSPFEIHTDNAIQFIVDDHTVTIDSDGKTIFGRGNISIDDTPLSQVNINADNGLGATAGNSQGILRLLETTGNADNLLFTSQRVSDGSDWQTAAHRIQRKVDSTKMGYIQFGNHAATNGDLITFGENETERMRIDAEGQVGIGTTSPSTNLEIKAPNNTDTTYILKLINSAESGFTQLGAYGIDTSAIDLILKAGGNDGLRVDKDTGRVSIGTTNPASLFEVAGASDPSILLKSTGTGSGDDTILRSRVGGTTASNYLYFGDSADSSAGMLRYAHSDDSMRFYVNNGAERLRIKNDGKVGIGTTSPSEALEVVGKIIATNGTESVELNNTGSIELRHSSNAFIDFKNADEDFDSRIQADSNGLGFQTGGAGLPPARRMTIDSSGNVGIGTTSPSTALDILNSSEDQITLTNNTGAFSRIRSKRGLVLAADYDTDSGASESFMAFETDNVERARIDASGNVMIGTTTVDGTGGASFRPNFDDGAARLTFNRANTTNNSAVLKFQNNGSDVGEIVHSNTATAYSTSSDYRLKEDILEMQDSISRVKALKPVNFAWKIDGTRVDGFLAHEAQEVVPEAISGTKDAVDEDGQPDYQGIDQSKLVPLLTKALQESLTKIESLEARVTALES